MAMISYFTKASYETLSEKFDLLQNWRHTLEIKISDPVSHENPFSRRFK